MGRGTVAKQRGGGRRRIARPLFMWKRYLHKNEVGGSERPSSARRSEGQSCDDHRCACPCAVGIEGECANSGACIVEKENRRGGSWCRCRTGHERHPDVSGIDAAEI